MSKKEKFNTRKLMEKAVEIMKTSIREKRTDDTITPKVGAVLWKPDGTIVTASRGELREGDHAEYTLIERKNGHADLGDCVLFATLEPCAPKSRNPPKIGCAWRITNARIKKVYYGCEDPHPKVKGEGLRYLKQKGIEVIPFDRDLQKVIEDENADFFDQARRKAEEEEEEPVLEPLPFDQSPPDVSLDDLDAGALSHYHRFLFKEGADGDEEFHRRLAHQGLLIRNDKGPLTPTRFAHLLFGKHPRDILPQAGILATIHGKEGEDPKDFDGPMVLGPDQVISWLRGKLPDAIDRSQAERKRINDAFYELVPQQVRAQGLGVAGSPGSRDDCRIREGHGDPQADRPEPPEILRGARFHQEGGRWKRHPIPNHSTMSLPSHPRSLAPFLPPKWRVRDPESASNSLSRHFSRQNGARDASRRTKWTDPAVYPAILRDSPTSRGENSESCHFSCQNGRKGNQFGQRSSHGVRMQQPPTPFADLSAVALAKVETYRPIGEIVTELDAIEKEAADTDKALRDILKQLGVSA